MLQFSRFSISCSCSASWCTTNAGVNMLHDLAVAVNATTCMSPNTLHCTLCKPPFPPFQSIQALWMYQCLQDNVAYLADASQQAEQSQVSTSAPSGAPGLATPPKHSVQVQQPSDNSPGAASPLPLIPGKGALPSMRYNITHMQLLLCQLCMLTWQCICMCSLCVLS